MKYGSHGQGQFGPSGHRHTGVWAYFYRNVSKVARVAQVDCETTIRSVIPRLRRICATEDSAVTIETFWTSWFSIYVL
ncbi:hypothetical protein V6Z12_D08G214400 [Gossypium hirsutum]